MKNVSLFIYFVAISIFTSCATDDVVLSVVAPDTYSFTRNGETSVDFSEQTMLIAMAEELYEELAETTTTTTILEGMFSHQAGEVDFSNTSLNSSDENIRNQVASSVDYFFSNTSEASDIREEFDNLIIEQIDTVFVNSAVIATTGNAGFLEQTTSNGTTLRYFNTQGVELRELFNKSLIGGLMVDQILNNFLSSAILDTGNNIQDNDDNILITGTNYTAMEHAWDEAYGYLFGAEEDASNPSYNADNFLNKYVNEVNELGESSGFVDIKDIAIDIFNAFKLGRAAIVAKNYDEREAQAEIIREKISLVIGVNVISSLEHGRLTFVGDDNTTDVDIALAFHQISEGLGFLYSLQFTREPFTTSVPTPYVTNEVIEGYFEMLSGTGNGLWENLTISDSIDFVTKEIEEAFGYEEGELTNLIE